jgi:hypothetical protein
MMGREAGSEQLTSNWWDLHQGWVLYPAAALSYVALGLAFKPALNWIVGPLWVLLVVWILPASITRLRASRR